MSASDFAARLEFAASSDSLADFYPLCSMALVAASSHPECAVQLATGTLAFMGREAPLSAPIAAHTCSLLNHVWGLNKKGVSAALLLSLAPLMRLFRDHLSDATVAFTVASLLKACVLQGAHSHAYQSIVKAGALALFANAARSHISVVDPDVAEATLSAAMNMCCNDETIKADVVRHGLDNIAIEAIFLRGRTNFLLASSASALLCNVMRLPGQRAKVLASGVVAAVVPALPGLLAQQGQLSPSVWGQFAAGAVVLPYELYEADFGPDDSVAAALVAALRVAVKTPHLEHLDPVVKRLVCIILNTCFRKPIISAAFRAHGAYAEIVSAIAKYPALSEFAAKAAEFLGRH